MPARCSGRDRASRRTATLRAHALARLGWVCVHAEGIRAGADVFFAALAEPSDDVRLRIEILEGLAWCLHSTRGVPAAAGARACRARAGRGRSASRPCSRARSRSAAFLDSLGGEGLALATVERALALDTRRRGRRCSAAPTGLHALLLGGAAPSPPRAIASTRSAARRSTAATSTRCRSSSSRSARCELLTGDWAAAAAPRARMLETTVATGRSAASGPTALAIEALVEAHLGLVEPAQEKIERGLEARRAPRRQPAGLELLATRGLPRALARRRCGCRPHARRASPSWRRRAGLLEPALFRFHGDAIEAKIALGRWAEAERC